MGKSKLMRSPFFPRNSNQAIALIYGGISKGKRQAILKNGLKGRSVYSKRKANGTPIARLNATVPRHRRRVLRKIDESLSSKTEKSSGERFDKKMQRTGSIARMRNSRNVKIFNNNLRSIRNLWSIFHKNWDYLIKSS